MPGESGSHGQKIGAALKTLRRISVLKDLPPDALEHIESQCRWSEYKEHEQIIDPGDLSGEVGFIVKGKARVVNYSATGRQVGFADYEAGSIIGELSAIDGLPRSAAIYALLRTVLATLDRPAFVELVRAHPNVAMRVLSHLTGVIREMNDRFLDLSAISDVQRVYYELLRLAEPSPDGDGKWRVFQMPRHKQLAESVGTTPEIVAHAVSQLMKAELVKRRSGTLELLDKTGIQQLAIMG